MSVGNQTPKLFDLRHAQAVTVILLVVVAVVMWVLFLVLPGGERD